MRFPDESVLLFYRQSVKSKRPIACVQPLHQALANMSCDIGIETGINRTRPKPAITPNRTIINQDGTRV